MKKVEDFNRTCDIVKIYNEKGVVNIPTDLDLNKPTKWGCVPHHLYVLSPFDDEIVAGDWFYKPDMNIVVKAEYTPYEGCRKIIASTDPELNLPGIDDIFLKEYEEKRGIGQAFVKFTNYLDVGRYNVLFTQKIDDKDYIRIFIKENEEKLYTREEVEKLFYFFLRR
jgi:hypothetical protein